MKKIIIIGILLINYSTCFASDENSAIALASQTAALLQQKQSSQLFNTSFQNDALLPELKKSISLDVQNIPVRNLLQLMADLTKQNMIISSTVTGNITLRLHNIPWVQALTVILQTQGLAKQQIGNVIVIAPVAEIATHAEAEFQAQLQLVALAPLQSALIPIQFGKATEIALLLKNQNHTLLSTRGSVSADARTNTVWVEDTPDKLIQIRSLIQQLDIPVKQILIEARIANVDTAFEQELGIRFGVTQAYDKVSSNVSKANQQNTRNLLSKLNIDLPAANIGNPGGAASLSLALATLGNSNLLDLELSALESEGGGEIISSPKIMTNNDQAAVILSGEEIPYQEATATGATSVTFKKAVLSLSVTPQINPNNQISLKLQVNQDKPSTTLVHGVPAIETREIQTHVLINNGETIVLGGIYEQTTRNQVERIPYISAIPIIGNLFKHKLMHKDRKELLIFVTPKIVG